MSTTTSAATADTRARPWRAARLVRSLACVVATAAVAPAVLAGPGHDHGDAAPTASGVALPRFTATSDLFELVGVLDGARLTLYLDRAADNSPVRAAEVELDIAGARHKAQRHDDEDHYEIALPAAPQPGVLPITATVQAGSETDLLAGELDLQAAEPATSASPSRPVALQSRWVLGGIGLAVVGAVVAAAVVITLRRRAAASTSPSLRPGGAA